MTPVLCDYQHSSQGLTSPPLSHFIHLKFGATGPAKKMYVTAFGKYCPSHFISLFHQFRLILVELSLSIFSFTQRQSGAVLCSMSLGGVVSVLPGVSSLAQLTSHQPMLEQLLLEQLTHSFSFSLLGTRTALYTSRRQAGTHTQSAAAVLNDRQVRKKWRREKPKMTTTTKPRAGADNVRIMEPLLLLLLPS